MLFILYRWRNGKKTGLHFSLTFSFTARPSFFSLTSQINGRRLYTTMADKVDDPDMMSLKLTS